LETDDNKENDRKLQRESMPKDYIESTPSGDHNRFFNAVGILSFTQQLLHEIESMVDELRYVIYYVCHNHLTYAKNCGEGYLPYAVRDDRIVITLAYYPEELDLDKSIRQTISEKIAPLINTVEDELTTNFNLTKQEIIDSISKNSVTNLWLKDAIK
jgi:hypothetical protein